MATPRMRPTFTHSLPAAPAAFTASLQAALRAASAPCRGTLFGTAIDGGAILRRHEQDQHFWSPALHLHVDGGDTGPWTLHGKFSPSSPVWTGFLAIYLSLTCVGIGAACYGGAQMILDEDPWAFVGVPIVVALALFTYGAAFIGQGLGSEDMYALRAFVDDVVARSATGTEPDEGAATLSAQRIS